MNDEIVLDGPEPAGLDVTPTRDLIAEWTARAAEVRVLELAQNQFPDISARLWESGTTCGLSCDSVEAASEIYAVLAEHAEEWCIVPELIADRACVFVHNHRFDRDYP